MHTCSETHWYGNLQLHLDEKYAGKDSKFEQERDCKILTNMAK